jgi:acetate kinase
MRILSLNCGSSSIKCALIDSASGARLAEWHAEEIGRQTRIRIAGQWRALSPNATFEQAATAVLQEVQASAEQLGGLDAVAHRIVHGGDRFVQPTRLDENMVRELDSLSQLAPLHNLPALATVRAAMKLLPQLQHIAVFDTAFHATLPNRARQYALPKECVERLHIRRYGFHGTSHSHVAQAVAGHLRTTPQQLRVVSCHLGNGASVCAIEYGRSVETSMGMTPLEGLVMGTRPGDLDPGVLLELMRSGMSESELTELLNKRSGLMGLTGTSDMREIEKRAAEGDENCRLAITLYAHRVRKYIGAYAAVMGGVDVLAFTGGIGENSAFIRHRCTQRLEFLGAVLDENRNRDATVSVSQPLAEISEAGSRARIAVVKADEEWSIAKQAAALLSQPDKSGALHIPVAVSARHAHLSQATVERLFGEGYRLKVRTALSQTGQYAAEETVTLIGPRGRIPAVRLMGPPRTHDQIEISRSDEFVLGIDAPVRISGDLKNSPGITLEGPKGTTAIPSGVITARRHIHMSPDDAARFGVQDHDTVEVRIDSEGRDLTFGDVTVRVSPDFTLEMHLDTDEANAAGIERGDQGELVEHGEVDVVISGWRTADGEKPR